MARRQGERADLRGGWSRDLGAYGQDHKAVFRDHYRKGEDGCLKLDYVR